MKLLIGENIKRLRIQEGLSQMELSELFGVSCQSVSRWETGSCYPDLELLPVISEYFHISVDELIGMTTERIQAKETEYMAAFQKALNRGQIYECITTARTGVAEIPASFPLQNALMYALFLSGDADGNIPEWKSNMQKYDAEITSLGEHIMKYCPDQKIRLEATARLAFNHCEMGRKDAALKIYETLPTLSECRELAMFPAIEKENLVSHAREVIQKGYQILCAGLYHLANSDSLSDEEEIQVLQTMEQLDTLLYEGKYPDSTWHKANLSTHQAQVLCRMKKTDEAIKKLHEARQTAANYDHQTEDITVHTLLMGETIFSRKNVETSDSRSLSNIVTEKWLTHTDFDPIRNEL